MARQAPTSLSPPKKCSPWTIQALMTIILLQWILLVYLLLGKISERELGEGNDNRNSAPLLSSGVSCSTRTIRHNQLALGIENDKAKVVVPYSQENSENKIFDVKLPVIPVVASANVSKQKAAFRGVAATLMLNNPKWFQRRYTMMIQNVLNNIPSDWGIQIFYTGKGQSQFGLDISPGLTRLINSMPDRIILTVIPNDVLKSNPKPNQMWATEWIWSNMVLSSSHNYTNLSFINVTNGLDLHEKQYVLLFNGNGAICSNAQTTLKEILDLELDYIGIPWNRNKGIGGDGSTHSIRNRNAMLQAIRYRKERGKSFDGGGREDEFFVRTLLAMNEEYDSQNRNSRQNNDGDNPLYRIASREQTEMLGGFSPQILEVKETWINDAMKSQAEKAGPPLVVSGTVPGLSNVARELMLDLCPELKVIFPSLHNPNCFGAHPNGEKCAESICALKKGEKKGGC